MILITQKTDHKYCLRTVFFFCKEIQLLIINLYYHYKCSEPKRGSQEEAIVKAKSLGTPPVLDEDEEETGLTVKRFAYTYALSPSF